MILKTCQTSTRWICTVKTWVWVQKQKKSKKMWLTAIIVKDGTELWEYFALVNKRCLADNEDSGIYKLSVLTWATTQSPGEIKRGEVSWILTKKLAQKRSRAGRWYWARERAGLLLLQLFPSGGATDIVFVILFCIAVGTIALQHCKGTDGCI